jgi:hypothetical protein
MDATRTSGDVTSAGTHESRSQHGDVNPLGDLVDLADRRRRLREQVGPDRSVEIDPDEQAELALELLADCRERHSVRWQLLMHEEPAE